MPQATTRTDWGWDDYLAWERDQPVKHEFVDGRVRAMVGGTGRHDLICNNLRADIHRQLRGSPCRVAGPDLKVRIGDNARYPDALIDCGPLDGSAVVAQRPVCVLEVLSRSTAWIDQTLKLRDYARVATIKSYVLISQDEPRILHYLRDGAGRLDADGAELLEGMDAVLTLSAPNVAMPLRSIFEGTNF